MDEKLKREEELEKKLYNFYFLKPNTTANMTTNWYESSTGEGLSASIGGFSLMGIAQAFSLIAGHFGYYADQNTVVAALNGVVTAIGSVVAAYGLLRKLFYAIKNRVG